MKIDTNGNWRLYSNTLPNGATPIGTVTVNGATGVLAHIERTNKYVQVNCGAVRNLDGRTVTGILGTCGRPQEIEEGKRVTLYLDKVTLDKAKALGDGNVSGGIRKAVKDATSNICKSKL